MSVSGPPNLRGLTAFPTRHGKVNIPQEVGVKYQTFAAQLLEDPTGAKVSSMEHKHGRDSLRINTEVLQEWLRGQGRRPVSWGTLIEVLRDIELGTLAGDLEEACSADVVDTEPSFPLRKNHPRTALTPWQITIAILVAAISLLAVLAIEYWLEKPVNGYKNILRSTYQNKSVTDPDHWLHVEMPFIDLTLTEGDPSPVRKRFEYRMQGKYNLTVDGVVNSVKEGSKILIEGRPGVGKTTLLRHIAKQWAELKYLQNFPLVVLVLLGHTPSSRITKLDSMLEYHSHGYPDTASVARELDHTGGKGICFLLDALDEYLPQEGDFIHQLIKGETHPDAAVIVTSRPNASYHLQQHFTRKIKVVGFLEHQIQQYIRKLPPDSAVIISEFLKQHRNVEHISYLPLHLAMVTYLALRSERVSLLDLDTDTKIYHMFVNLTYRQRYKDVEDLDEIHNQAFGALSKIAFDATTRSGDYARQPLQRGYYGATLRLHHLRPELRAKVESFSILTIDRQHEGDRVGKFFTFSHNTFQEFFAAYYLTTLPHNKQMEAIQLDLLSHPLMWRFFFGLLRAHPSETTTKLFERFAHIQISTRWSTGKILRCAYELKQAGIAEVLVQVLNYSITVDCRYPSECTAGAYAISLNPHQFKRLKIRFHWSSVANQEACFASMLAELPENNQVVHVTLDGLSLSDRTVSAVVKLLEYFPNLQRLELFDLAATPGVPFTVARELEVLEHVKYVGISVEGIFGRPRQIHNIAAVIEFLTHLPHLEHLTLSNIEPVQGTKIVTSLEHLTNLQHLDLSPNSIGVDGAVTIAKRLKNAVNLQYLDLSQNSIGVDGAVAIANVLRNAVDLQYLDLKDNDIGNDGAVAIAEGLKNAAALRTLKLGGNTIGDDGVAACTLAESIKQFTSLQVLELDYNEIGDDEVAALAEGIKHLTSLQTLDLAINVISDDGAAVLTESIKQFTSLQVLELDYNIIGDDGVVALTEGIKHLTSLQVLGLNGNKIGDDGVAALTEGIKHLTSLQTLNLGGNRIGDEGVAALAEGLKRLTSLQTLNLGGNRIGDEGVAALAEGLKHLTSLQTLNLGGNRIGDDGVAALAEGIKHLTSLQTILLGENRIVDDGVAALAEGLKHLTSLQTLDMSRNRIGDDGVTALTRGLKNLTSLKVLILCGNEIGDVGAEKLAEETKHLSSLEGLHLWDNEITDKGIAKLTEARKTVWTGLNSLFFHI